ncbi:SRPBCC domain-containing protein [Agromyces sp. ISL-38]|uniref:SRPBCC domain-containing protein n=1 Tax=Agromyces sp. ISL-38 TaxID=2819107 RepID=UPI001BE61FB6|nr:SRPBCC domain-containing protein [Agromyces sp. ISL-38]MBT2499043.1 SRPBCC domain-containing protein [Agromyces sp. ISL-38]
MNQEGNMQDFEMTIYIKADPQVVWDAITGDEGNRAVMFGSVMRGALVPGGRYEFVGPGESGDETVHVYGEVLEAEPGAVLSLSEHPGPVYRENHAELTSRMTWRLESAGDRLTKATFTNDEWSEGHPSQAESAATWPMVLSSFKSWIETGEAIPLG